jgi:lipase chaperone LimK
MDYFLGVLLAIVGGAIGAFAAYFLGNFGVLMRLSRVESELIALRNRLAGAAGNVAREEDGEAFGTAMGEALSIMQSAELTQEQKTDAIKALALKYPRLTLKLLRKAGGIRL